MKCSTIHLCICCAVLAKHGVAESVEATDDELAPMGEPWPGMISQPTAMLEVMVLDQLRSNESEHDLGPHNRKKNDEFVKKVAGMIKVLKDGIKKAKKREQGLLDQTLKAFNRCVKLMSGVSLKISQSQSQIKALYMDSQKCSQSIRTLYAQVIRCPKVVKYKKDGVQKGNQLVQVLSKHKFTPKTCKVQRGEGHILWLQRMVGLVERRKRKLSKIGINVDKDGVKLLKKVNKCKAMTMEYNKRRKVCLKKQTKLKLRQCKLVATITNGCSSYKSCYNEAARTFLATVKKAKVSEKTIKLEWRALSRIQCYLKPFASAQKDKAANLKELEKCNKKKQYNTDMLSLTYLKEPPRVKCPKIIGKIKCPGMKKKR